jgi:hypothetical protein
MLVGSSFCSSRHLPHIGNTFGWLECSGAVSFSSTGDANSRPGRHPLVDLCLFTRLLMGSVPCSSMGRALGRRRALP